MWQTLWQAVLENLIDVGMGLLLFVATYVANMAFSIFLNIKILDQKFDGQKILDSLLKVGTFGIGTTLLSIGVTSIPIVCDLVGFTIPSEYIDVFSKLAILGVTITAACKYALEAFSKMKAILAASVNPVSTSATVAQTEKDMAKEATEEQPVVEATADVETSPVETSV